MKSLSEYYDFIESQIDIEEREKENHGLDVFNRAYHAGKWRAYQDFANFLNEYTRQGGIDFRGIISARMDEEKISISEIARRVGVDRLTISNFLSKGQSTGIDTIAKIMNELDIVINIY
jgi:DNA-binding phage protein